MQPSCIGKIFPIYFSAVRAGAARALAAEVAPGLDVPEMRQVAATLAARTDRSRGSGSRRVSGLRIVLWLVHAANQRPPNAAYPHW